MSCEDWLFAVNAQGLLWLAGDGMPLTLAALPAAAKNDLRVVGQWQGRNCWAQACEQLPPPAQLQPLRSRLGVWPEPLFALAGRARQLLEFDANHRFCGHCAAPLKPRLGDGGRDCPACGLTVYPRLSPCVIVAVWRPGEILLAHHRRHNSPIHTVLAGFIEPGESAEQAAVREVGEEVGVAIGDLRYCASQPWPFPHSLMLGFTARWQAGEIQIDDDELSHAAWYPWQQLPQLPPPGTIALRLIERVCLGQA